MRTVKHRVWERVRAVATSACMLTAIGCTDPYDRHFSLPLPPGSRLINSHQSRSGWSDMTYIFEFEVADDSLRDQLIKELNLQRELRPTSNAIDSKRIPWWPSYEERTRMEGFGWTDQKKEEFKSIWYDNGNQVVYVEIGNW